MSYKPKYFGTAQDRNGRIVFVMMEESKEEYEKFMSRQKPGQELEMTMVRKHKPRTTGAPGEETNFNGYYWKCIVQPIADAWGEFDTEYVHQVIQRKVGNTMMNEDGKIVAKGTSDMSGGEFSEYCSRVRMWAGIPGNATSDGMYLLEPHEADYE